MATLFNQFVCLCRYLQDPYHVARFQQLCGVKGTFPRKSAGSEETGRDVSPNGVCMNQGDGEDQDLDMKSSLVRRGLLSSSNEIKSGSETSHFEDKDITFSSGASEKGDFKGRLKPLRKNSLTDDDVEQEFIIQNKFLFYLFTMGTELGNEMFFIMFFPFLMWNVDAYVTRSVILVWVWILFFGQSTKDLVGWTRPASPPVVKVEVFYNFEYSMPSVHAMTGTSVPFCLFMITYDRWEVIMILDK